MTHLTPASCDLFNRPCFQFAQLKKYAPESIPQLKADYKAAWENWRAIILRVADCGELPLRDAADYYSIGKHLERAQLGSVDSAAWIADTLRALQPLYEACHP